jgi:hypothetical protein
MLLLPYLMIAAGLLATLVLFISLKQEIRGLVRRQKARMEEMAGRLVEPAPMEEERVEMVAPLRAGLNLSKRVHALRMLRRGEDVSHVAAALGVPRKEVELLIRVQSMGRARSVGAGLDS